jgi:hypothetical protein
MSDQPKDRTNERDTLDERISRAASGLRREAPIDHKLALLRKLRETEVVAPSLWQRLGILWERKGNEMQQPLYGLAFVAVLALVLGVGLSFDPNGADAPEIDDIEFSGGSAVVIETHSEHTTLIWLSEVEEDELVDPENEVHESVDVLEEAETDEEDI